MRTFGKSMEHWRKSQAETVTGRTRSRSRIGDSREKLGEYPMANYRIPFVQNYASDAWYSTEYDRESHRGNRVLAWLRSRLVQIGDCDRSILCESSLCQHIRKKFIFINLLYFLLLLPSFLSFHLSFLFFC